MSDQIASPLDPQHYIEHVTRTAMLLESLARDMKSLADKTERGLSNTDGLRVSLTLTQTEFAVFRVDTGAKIATNRETIDALIERIKWLNRLIIGAVLAGLISGIVAIIFKTIQ